MSDLHDALPGWRPWDDGCHLCGQPTEEPVCPRCLHPSSLDPELDLEDLDDE